MRRNANVGCHQVGLQSTDRLMLGAISRLEEHGVSDGSQGIPKRENVRISAASHAEGRHARWGWCGSTASRDRACEGLVHMSTLKKGDRQGERWNGIRQVLVHTLKASRHRRRLLGLADVQGQQSPKG